MRPRWILLVAIAFLTMPMSAVLADEAPGASNDAPSTSVDGGEELPGLGKIIGSPDAGPGPDDAGDRGGWAQLALAGILLVAVGFIAFRITRGITTSDSP